MEITDLTKREMVSVFNGIQAVRAQSVPTEAGLIQTRKGFTFPFKIMYTNTYNEQRLQPHMKAYQEAVDGLRESCKDKKGTVDMKAFTKELEALLDEEAEDLRLRTIDGSMIEDMLEDEYFQKVNSEAGLQEYVSAMGRLIIYDFGDETPTENKDKP